MTKTLMARLFLVPAILVSMLVVGLMTVVLLFGWPGFGQRVPLMQLVEEMEGSRGDKMMGVALLPRDKDVWLAAQELAERLKQRDKELKPADVGPLADRLAKLYETSSLTSAMPPGEARPASGNQSRLAEFTLLALTRLAAPRSVTTLIEALSSPHAVIRQTALRGLVELRGMPETHASVAAIIPLLRDGVPEVRLVACAALGQIATLSDSAAEAALAACLSEVRDVQWNAALALARMGSLRSKDTLLTMLDRKEWERTRVQYVDGGQQIDQAMTSDRIAAYLGAAIDASAGLNDPELTAVIRRLESDPAVSVRQKAIEARTPRKVG